MKLAKNLRESKQKKLGSRLERRSQSLAYLAHAVSLATQRGGTLEKKFQTNSVKSSGSSGRCAMFQGLLLVSHT
jgi:hypothetical protein